MLYIALPTKNVSTAYGALLHYDIDNNDGNDKRVPISTMSASQFWDPLCGHFPNQRRSSSYGIPHTQDCIEAVKAWSKLQGSSTG